MPVRLAAGYAHEFTLQVTLPREPGPFSQYFFLLTDTLDQAAVAVPVRGHVDPLPGTD